MNEGIPRRQISRYRYPPSRLRKNTVCLIHLVDLVYLVSLVYRSPHRSISSFFANSVTMCHLQGNTPA